MTILSRGAEWHKWDLHFHTQSSDDYKDKSVTNKDIINALTEKNVSVVAITDHNNIDVERIEELRTLADNKIIILPGIEVRTGAGTGENIHIIGIFSEKIIKAELEKIQRAFLAAGIDEQRSRGKREDEIYLNLDKTIEILRKYDAVISIHAASKKSGGIEQITNALPVSRAIKEDIAKKIDIFEIGKIEDVEEYETKVFPVIGFAKSLILCSDNHNIKEYSVKEFLWIKAELSFQGLKQVLNEFKNRIIIDKEPILFANVKNNPKKYIKALVVKPKDATNDTWFNLDIPLNSELVAIIGNKGSGKSAIAEIVALAANTKNENFSFLNNQKFLKDDLGTKFTTKIIWNDNTESENRSLNDIVQKNNEEFVKFLPQKHIENICNDVSSISKFQQELNKIIFSHFPKEQKIGKDNFEEFINEKSRAINNLTLQLKTEVNEINEQICFYEEKISIENITLQNNTKKRIEDEIVQHQLLKPQEIKDPSITSSPEEQKALGEINLLSRKINELDVELKETEQLINEKSEIRNKMLILLDRFKNFIINIKKQKDIFKTEFDVYSIKMDEIFVMNEPNLSSIEEALKLLENTINEKLSNKKGIEEKLKNVNLEIKKIEATNAEKIKKYSEYVQNLQSWEKRFNELSIEKTKIENELQKILKDYQEKLQELRIKRLDKTKEIFDKKNEIVQIYTTVKESILSILSNNQQYPIEIKSYLGCSNLFENINSNVNHKSSEYFKDDEKIEVLQTKIMNLDYNNFNEIKDLLLFIEDNLKSSKPIKQQLKKDASILEFYNHLYYMDYINPQYALLYDQKNITSLSPGEKGILLLIFYLILDKNEYPLIIDQPEDNLDNQSIKDLLIPAIREAKKKRQVIMVTHNPNIAVVTDAEQIIRVHIDKTNNNKVFVESGPVENQTMNKHIVDILEGTMSAFDNRNVKYIRCLN